MGGKTNTQCKDFFFLRERLWSTQWEMFALEAIWLLRCCCLRQRPGEAPAPARPPASFSKPFNTTLTAAAAAQSQNQWCQIPAAEVFSSVLFLCVVYLVDVQTNSQVCPRGVKWWRWAHPTVAGFHSNLQLKWFIHANVCSHYRKSKMELWLSNLSVLIQIHQVISSPSTQSPQAVDTTLLNRIKKLIKKETIKALATWFSRCNLKSADKELPTEPALKVLLGVFGGRAYSNSKTCFFQGSTKYRLRANFGLWSYLFHAVSVGLF